MTKGLVIINDGGGLQNGRGGGAKRSFTPSKKKRGGGGVLDMLKVGTISFEVVLTRELEVLAIAMWGAKSFHPLKGGTQKVLPCLEGGLQKVSDLRFCSPPLPVINDRSLRCGFYSIGSMWI